MNKEHGFYKFYNRYGLEGYYVPVRNTFSNCIEKEFIPLKAKDIYEKSFGERLISDSEFIDWYTKNSVNF